MTFSISGKTAVVTGAASGVGLAIARHFADRGANVVFADPDEKTLTAQMADQVEEDGPIRLFFGDFRQKLACANLLSTTIDAFDRVDILVNGARQMVTGDPLDTDADTMGAMIDHNLLTSLRLSQIFARRMIGQSGKAADREAPAGSIINLSSIAARRIQPELMGYSVSCAAIEQLTRSLAVALAPHRIRVNAVAFGSVMSASLQGALKGHAEHRADIIGHTPLARIAGAGELAEVAQFLASDGSGFMTGEVLTVDGGRSLVDAVHFPAH